MKKLFIFIFFLTLIHLSKAQSVSKADSFFYSANSRLKSKWNFIDTSTFARSIHDYAEAIRLKPGYWQAYRNRARIFIHQKKYDRALEDLTTAIVYADKSHYSKLFEMRGMVFYELGMNQETADDLSIALKDPEDKAKTLLYMARAKWRLGFQKDACKDYHQAVSINPSLKVKNEIIKCESH